MRRSGKTAGQKTGQEAQPAVEELVQAVQSSARYQHISPGLIRRISLQELEKRRDWKEALKATKNKLHQVGGAYFSSAPTYPRWLESLERIPPIPPGQNLSSALDPSRPESQAIRAFCLDVMRQHASTRERLPILESFFERSLESFAPVHSVLDLACGLNPLAIPWMPLATGFTYQACDIFTDMVGFLNRFFKHLDVAGMAQVCDLIEQVPQEPVQLAYLLKTIPCLEQVDKLAGLRILEAVRAEHILVSFPAHSLGGRSKGMPDNYTRSFRDLLAGKDWQVREIRFPTEVAFLVTKGAL